ncbi:hypothetical protein [Guptibacillus hwajinpoensis]|uniref:hypothetical protein n=1 Tax=Guptibacillus hwajinpoensis TaxID=208199 RepID=UPI003CFFF272
MIQALGEQSVDQAQRHGDQGGQEQGAQTQNQTQAHGDQDGQDQGAQTQNQTQAHGDQDGQDQGAQTQNQTQAHGDQDGQDQGAQTQNQTQAHGDQGDQDQGDQTQDQAHGDQGQTLGPQTLDGDQNLEGHTNNSPLDNNQTIDTSVSGVTVNLTTSCKNDCECSSSDDCGKYRKRSYRTKGNYSKKESQHTGKKKDDCSCCVATLSQFLSDLQMFQLTDASSKPINLYLTTPINAVTNPVPDQAITRVAKCSTVTYKLSSQVGVNPSTTTQICKIAGVRADIEDEEIFNYLLSYGTTCMNPLATQETYPKCKCDDCGCCANGIGEELDCTTRFGIGVRISVEGQSDVIQTPPANLFVLNLCDCLVFLTDNLDPTMATEIYVFSLCAITGVTVDTQTI